MAAKHVSSLELGINRKRVSSNALKVVRELQRAGYDGYLVGGCVRDLLMGVEPKDFDVATNARPEQVKVLFNRARIIGRRFKIVHVRFNRFDVIEVATYRANPESRNKKNWMPWKATKNQGRILDDNEYGSIEEDALRRDFTINALYYDPEAEEIIDFVNALKDIKQRKLTMIGKPAQRFSEDPVRMLRVIRFMAKLDIAVDKGMQKQIKLQSNLLEDVPAARLFDETLKLFHHAHGVKSWQLLASHNLLQVLFPQVMPYLDQDKQPHAGDNEKLILEALSNTDRRIQQGKPVIPAFLFAAVLWAPFNDRVQSGLTHKRHLRDVIFDTADEVFARQSPRIAVPRRVSGPAIEIWEMQWQLERRRPRSIRYLLQHRRFRAAYDFLLLRCKIGQVEGKLVDWWTDIQEQDVEQQIKMTNQLHDGGRRRGKKKTGYKPRHNRQKQQKKSP